MKIETIFQYIVNEFDAQIVPLEECKNYLKKDEGLISGFHLCNAKLNYKLLSESDFSAFSKEKRKWIQKNQISPFDDILIIFFKDENNHPHFKVINGMASKLIMDLHSVMKTIEIDD